VAEQLEAAHALARAERLRPGEGRGGLGRGAFEHARLLLVGSQQPLQLAPQLGVRTASEREEVGALVGRHRQGTTRELLEQQPAFGRHGPDLVHRKRWFNRVGASMCVRPAKVHRQGTLYKAVEV
jgi:hypothetical protein